MLSHWPIRTKLQAGPGLLLVTVLALFGSAYYGLYAYRELVKSLSARSAELPLASHVLEPVSDLRVTLSQAKERLDVEQFLPEDSLTADSDDKEGDRGDAGARRRDALGSQLPRSQCRDQLDHLVDASIATAASCEESPVDAASQPGRRRRANAARSPRSTASSPISGRPLDKAVGPDWFIDQRPDRPLLGEGRDCSRRSPPSCPATSTSGCTCCRATCVRSTAPRSRRVGQRGHRRGRVRRRRRVFYKWFAHPLQMLVDGSRQVAAGKFDHRIQLDGDEMGELAEAMNAMTARFQEIRDDLDRQVHERTKQVVRSEQLASVGFLAAGVAHEINNPLASIALCSESLEGRLQELLDDVDAAKPPT